MSDLARSRRIPLPLGCCLIGIVAAVAWFALTAHLGFDLDDEGYYWYGSQRTADGALPIRDFTSYDIGRYFYTAAIFRLAGDTGIMTLRAAAYAVIGLLVALVCFVVADGARRREANHRARAAIVVVATVITLAFAFPYYKVFDLTAAIVLLTTLYALLLRGSHVWWLILGVIVGVLADVGRNHGVYAVCASALVSVLLWCRSSALRPDGRAAVSWLGGVCVGYAPCLLLLAADSGFANANIDWTLGVMRAGATNFPVPVPWPWSPAVDAARDGVVYALHEATMGCGSVVLLTLPVLALWRLVRRRSIDDRWSDRRPTMDPSQAALMAATCVAIPYAHYAFSRADNMHLAIAIFPWIVVWLTTLDRLRFQHAVMAVAVGGVAAMLLLFESPPVRYLMRGGERWATIRVGPHDLLVEPATARLWKHREDLVDALRPGQSFLALPDMPALHAAHRQRMPVRDIYVTSGTSDEEERSEMRRIALAAPDLILISDRAIDDRQGRRFSHQRFLTYAWILEHYDRSVSAGSSEDDELEVFRSRRADR